jgi:osmotically-inducible protein OsmY
MEDESSVAAAVTAKLDKKQFQNVKVTVKDGVATLTGTVDLFEYKNDADKRVHKVKGVVAVRNEIQVAGPDVSDEQLKDKLLGKLQYDRVGYGNAFNAITLDVHNGVVTLGGHARTPVDKDSALALVSTYPGVKEVSDEIEVDPVSPMDDRIRMEVARSVYGFPSLNKYAAYLRANSVPGVFSVKNYILVANQQPEKGKGGN